MFRNPLVTPLAPDVLFHWLSFRNALTSAIRTARRRVLIMAYVVNCNINRQGDPITLIFSLLEKKIRDGLDVRIIIDDPAINRPNYHCNRFMTRWFEIWNIPYCTPPPRFTSHCKAIIIDDSVLFLGSHNLAKSSFTNPLDCTVEFRSPALVAEFAAAYDIIWYDVAMKSHNPPFVRAPGTPRVWMDHREG